MTDNVWQTLAGVAAAVAAFLLTQNDVTVEPIAKVVLGAILVALAVVNPKRATA